MSINPSRSFFAQLGGVLQLIWSFNSWLCSHQVATWQFHSLRYLKGVALLVMWMRLCKMHNSPQFAMASRRLE
jgi:hypothetical protein